MAGKLKRFVMTPATVRAQDGKRVARTAQAIPALPRRKFRMRGPDGRFRGVRKAAFTTAAESDSDSDSQDS